MLKHELDKELSSILNKLSDLDDSINEVKRDST